MRDFKLPLSGDVNQAINPWTWFFRSVGSQFGLINVNLGKSSDPELEEEILEDVGTYGRQLGRVIDAMKVLLEHVDGERLNGEERKALDAFWAIALEIDHIKNKRQLGTDSAARVEKQAA